MSQIVFGLINGEAMEKILPNAEEEVMPGIMWGRFEEILTPANWAVQCWLRSSKDLHTHRFCIGETLAEELAACLLAGHGVSAEIGLAAFDAIRNENLLAPDRTPPAGRIAEVLRQPLRVGNRFIRYRFHKQKAHYISEGLRFLATEEAPSSSHVEFRDWLMGIPGVGYKTASFVTRNWLNSDEVAILDVHVMRAGIVMRLFNENDRVEKNYRAIEAKFLEFAKAIGVRAAWLDGIMWENMRIMSTIPSPYNSALNHPSIPRRKMQAFG